MRSACTMRRLNAPTGAWCSLTQFWRCLPVRRCGLNAPTGAWCSLTSIPGKPVFSLSESQCTYRCVVLPDITVMSSDRIVVDGLNAPTGAWCSLTHGAGEGARPQVGGLNAPTGAWCSLTRKKPELRKTGPKSQCTYRCVVLPDRPHGPSTDSVLRCLNAPTGAWCSLTKHYDQIITIQ